MAIADKKSPLYNQTEEAINVDNGRLFITNDTSKGETYSQIFIKSKMPLIETEITTNVSTKETQQIGTQSNCKTRWRSKAEVAR